MSVINFIIAMIVIFMKLVLSIINVLFWLPYSTILYRRAKDKFNIDYFTFIFLVGGQLGAIHFSRNPFEFLEMLKAMDSSGEMLEIIDLMIWVNMQEIKNLTNQN